MTGRAVMKIEKPCTPQKIYCYMVCNEKQWPESIQSIYNTSKTQKIISHTHFRSTWARHLDLRGAGTLALQVGNTNEMCALDC